MSVANRARLAALACCLLAMLLGAWALDARSLWGDEAFSVWASKQSALALIGGLDAQPPLYHLLLGATRALMGESVFAIRFLSLACGVLLVAVAARLGQRMGGPLASLMTALLMATSPILIYFEQEARMYALGALLAGGAMLVTVVLLDGESARRRAPASDVFAANMAYVALALGALFTHYYAVGVLAANALALGISALRAPRAQRRRAVLGWLAVHGTIAVIFGSWFLALQSRYVARSAGDRRIVPPLDHIIANIGRGLEGLIFGMRADGGTQAAALLLFALALAGLIGYWRRGRRTAALLIAGWIAFSLGIVLLTASPAGLVPDFNPRYFLFALLPLALAAAGWALIIAGRAETRTGPVGSTDAQRRGRMACGLMVLVAFAPALIGLTRLYDAAWAKSRYAALVAAVRERARPGDGLVLINSDQFPLLDYYGPVGLATWIVPNNRLTREADAIAAEFDAFARDKSRVWLVNYGWAQAMQPRSVVEQELNSRGARTFADGFQDASVAVYDLTSTPAEAPVEQKEIGFGGQIRLVGLRERARAYRPGDAVTLDLVWRAETRPAADYTVFMHLRRADDGAQIAAFDSPPVNGAAPTASWSPGALITDTRAVQIPADAQPGEYDVVIGWYRYPSFERLPVDGQEATEVAVSRVTISPP